MSYPSPIRKCYELYKETLNYSRQQLEASFLWGPTGKIKDYPHIPILEILWYRLPNFQKTSK